MPFVARVCRCLQSLLLTCFASAALLPVCAQAHSTASSTERAFEAARRMGAPELYAFLKPFPKGADLHMHLSGAVYAETFIHEAARTHLCIAPVDPGTPATPEDRNAVRFVEPTAQGCTPGDVPASDALNNQPLYDDLIDSFSMRAFVPTAGINGHDQFFATFDRVTGLKNFSGEWLDEVATRAATQNEQYLEIMVTPPFSQAAALGYKLGWPQDAERSITRKELAHLRDALLAGGLRNEIAADRQSLDEMEAGRQRIEHCGSSQDAAASAPERPCSIVIRYLYQVLRGFPPQQVFAQTLLAFETASADPRFVGLNFVMPEDGRLSMQDYTLQMQMLDYLHSVYPNVHITLHAGELAPGLVPPQGLTFHIRQAVDLGHAERIGHGVDVLYEDHPEALLQEMHDRHIMVEVNLTSNDVILGIKGSNHPLHAYMAAHVPFALSTDDEGVSRIDLTHEYVKAVLEQGLSYDDLKLSARNSLEYSFLPGKSLWAAPSDYTHTVDACPAHILPHMHVPKSCSAFLSANLKAAEQFELEKRFAQFEDRVPPATH